MTDAQTDEAPRCYRHPDRGTYIRCQRCDRPICAQCQTQAAVGVQCTSPLFARTTFWCVIRTLEAAGFAVRPYHAAVPSFGVWGFALARRGPFDLPTRLPPGLKFLSAETLPGLFAVPPDLGPVPVEVNRLDNQVLVRYHDSDWRRYEGN